MIDSGNDRSNPAVVMNSLAYAELTFFVLQLLVLSARNKLLKNALGFNQLCVITASNSELTESRTALKDPFVTPDLIPQMEEIKFSI